MCNPHLPFPFPGRHLPQLSFSMDENAVVAMIAKSNEQLLQKMVCFCLNLFALLRACD